jgi:mannose/fructose-specific phosphotransferase system component IIA
VISISSRVSVVEIKERIKAAIEELFTPEGLVVFIDMPGGTPANLTFPLIKDRRGVELVGGVNLYMLVSAFTHREEPVLEKFVEKVVADGRKSVADIRQMFLSRTR